MKKKTIMKILRWFVPILLVCIIVGSGYQLINKYLSDQKAAREYQELRELAALEDSNNELENNTSSTEIEEEVSEDIELNYPDLGFDFQKIAKLNEDFVGWLYYPGLEISYPVLQGEDNNYYLDHSFKKQEVSAGCIFMDYGASSDWSDRNTFVFGHSMRDGSMFGSLRELIKDPDIFIENPYFYIYTEKNVSIYEIFSYYETQSDSDRYMIFTKDETYDIYVDWALENSVAETQRDMSKRGNIVSLSTCYGTAGTTNRILVHGALNSVEELEE